MFFVGFVGVTSIDGGMRKQKELNEREKN